MSKEKADVLKEALLVIHGTSKKNKEYKMVVVKKDCMFNSFFVNACIDAGVELIDCREISKEEKLEA